MKSMAILNSLEPQLRRQDSLNHRKNRKVFDNLFFKNLNLHELKLVRSQKCNFHQHIPLHIYRLHQLCFHEDQERQF